MLLNRNTCLKLIPLAAIVLLAPCVDAQETFAGCSVEEYYSSTDRTSKSSLAALLTATHRRVLPYTKEKNTDDDDVWRALMDLDVGEELDTVHLIYRDRDVKALLFNVPDGGWNREHVWPKSRGVGTSGSDFTDIHHLKPSDWNVNSSRGNKFIGRCQEDCTVPAHEQAAADTSSGTNVFLPPVSARGIVARALMYMDLRYNGGRYTEDLVLTDCPSGDDTAEMAYLSQLLEWHEEYPPTEAEETRNRKACERWQGNRNPFVDFPELASMFFGEPQSRPYDCSLSPTPVRATRNAGTGSSCTGVRPGSIMVIGVNSDNPDFVSMVALTNIAEGTKIIMTDNAWTGTNFRSNEGTVEMTVGSGGMIAGTVFCYGCDDSTVWQSVGGTFSLAATGDTVLLYCETDTKEIVHISGFSFSGDWTEKDLTESEYGTVSSALPESLEDVAVTLSHMDNYMYSGTRSGTMSSLISSITSRVHWNGSNSDPFSFESMSFTVSDSSDSSCTGVRPGSIMVIGVNSDNPDFVSMVALTNIAEGTKIIMTDNAWTGTNFRSNEGTVEMTVGSGGMIAGTVFCYGCDDSTVWQSVGGTFSLAATGDTVLLYCETDTKEIVHISGFSFSGDWTEKDLTESEYGTVSSALPESLEDVAVTLSHMDNYMYSGTRSGTMSSLISSITSRVHWAGSNIDPFSFESASFTVSGAVGGGTWIAMEANGLLSSISGLL